MKIIGAGLMRTATTTQMYALEQLGFGPCYHMRDQLANLEDGLPLWEAVAEGKPDWDRIFDGASSTVDWPSARFYGQLAERYPDAKVLLSVRPAADWVASMRETVWGMFHGDSVLRHVNEARARLDPLWERYLQLMRSMSWDEEAGALAGGETYTDAGLGAAMERWNDEVQRSVDPDRLLVWSPADGWEPLCDFLGVEAPAEPLPRLNETSAFREGIIGAALDTINDWWSARERPASGLHGAALA
jgi:hypothetical protein